MRRRVRRLTQEDDVTHSVEHDLELTTSALDAGVAALGQGGANEIDRWVQRLEGSDYPQAGQVG